MDDAIVSKILAGRPFGGLSILVRNTLAAKAKLVSMDTHFIATSLKNILFVNVFGNRNFRSLELSPAPRSENEVELSLLTQS